jgi:hypothetical protein
LLATLLHSVKELVVLIFRLETVDNLELECEVRPEVELVHLVQLAQQTMAEQWSVL